MFQQFTGFSEINTQDRQILQNTSMMHTSEHWISTGTPVAHRHDVDSARKRRHSSASFISYAPVDDSFPSRASSGHHGEHALFTSHSPIPLMSVSEGSSRGITTGPYEPMRYGDILGQEEELRTHVMSGASHQDLSSFGHYQTYLGPPLSHLQATGTDHNLMPQPNFDPLVFYPEVSNAHYQSTSTPAEGLVPHNMITREYHGGLAVNTQTPTDIPGGPPRVAEFDAEFTLPSRTSTKKQTKNSLNRPVFPKQVDHQGRASSSGPLKDAPDAAMPTPDLEILASDAFCLWPKLFLCKGFLRRLVGNGYNQADIATALSYFRGVDVSDNLIYQQIKALRNDLPTPEDGWSGKGAAYLRQEGMIGPELDLRISDQDLPKGATGKIPRHQVKLVSLANGVFRWPQVGGRFWTPSIAAVRYAAIYDTAQTMHLDDVPPFAQQFNVVVPPPLQDQPNRDIEFLEWIRTHLIDKNHDFGRCSECN